MSERELVDRVWYSSDGVASATRLLLAPFERVFRGVVGARDMLYDAGWLPSHATAIPAVSVGNLTVGGTGKTPMAAWIASGLAARGARPAIVLRGYGDDEPLVHRRLNPDIPVVADGDRVAGIVRAAAAGADIAVLDDAFQHRRARRDADLVLVSADAWTPEIRLLPAGPWREPLESLRRATLIIVTRKAATDHVVEQVHERLAKAAPGIPRVGVHLALNELINAADAAETRPLDALAGAVVHAVVSVADPRAFIGQIEALGARATASVFPDHHAFTDADVDAVIATAGSATWIVCTLKDAVKLAPRWPRLAPSLWYVSQHVMVERGVGGIERLLDDLVRARSKSPASPTAG